MLRRTVRSLHEYAVIPPPVERKVEERSRRMSDSSSPSTTPRNPSAPIKVAIVEDERDIRECLCVLVNGTDGYTCSGSYRTMEEALEKLPRQMPDVVLSDIGLPGMSGIEGVRTSEGALSRPAPADADRVR